MRRRLFQEVDTSDRANNFALIRSTIEVVFETSRNSRKSEWNSISNLILILLRKVKSLNCAMYRETFHIRIIILHLREDSWQQSSTRWLSYTLCPRHFAYHRIQANLLSYLTVCHSTMSLARRSSSDDMQLPSSSPEVSDGHSMRNEITQVSEGRCVMFTSIHHHLFATCTLLGCKNDSHERSCIKWLSLSSSSSPPTNIVDSKE